MKTYFTVICIFFSVSKLLFSQNKSAEIADFYRLGERFYNSKNPTKATDNQAKAYFSKIIANKNNSKQNAYYFAKAYNYLGIIAQMEGNNQAAKKFYKSAIHTASQQTLHDSLSFKPLLYLGSIYYNSFVFDTCYLYLNKAERILQKFPQLSESERLYNAFGALYFEAGNFRQSVHYFKKSINIRKKNAINTDFTYLNNLASALQFLGKTDSSLVIFEQLAKQFPEETTIKLNQASALLDKNLPEKAIVILQKLNKTETTGHEITYFNLLGKAYFAQKNYKKAQFFLEKAVSKSNSIKTPKNTWVGISYRLLGQIAESIQKYEQALTYYQKSIIELNYPFNYKNVAKNPLDFSEDVHSFNLIKSLTAKALCLKKVYNFNKNKTYFLFAENCFFSLKKLIARVSGSYNNEDSRLDFTHEIQPIFAENTELYLKEYHRTEDDTYLQKAFKTTDEGKATILSLTINDQKWKQNSDIPDSLLAKEEMMELTKRALLRQIEHNKKQSVNDLENKLNDLTINISRLKAQLEKYPKFNHRKYGLIQKSELATIQKALNRNDCILIFFEGITETGIFLVKKSKLNYVTIKNYSTTKELSFQLKHLLKNNDFQQTLVVNKINKELYNQLILPFEQDFDSQTNLIIIADGEYNGLPFEVLQDNNNKYLVEKWPVSYLFSAKFLEKYSALPKGQAIAFAPFAANSWAGFSKLVYSKNEVEAILKSKCFLNEKATKKAFENEVKNASIIHLATHAVTDNEKPENSFIQFYPASAIGPENRVYLFELSPGLITKNALVFLSSCESVGSQNIAGEGIRGLSRAFYLAGSKNIVSSLWKAEDFATAYISGHFYEHISAGKPYEKALQLAKIDLLNDPKMVQFHNPKYWAHLIFMGNGLVENPWFEQPIFFIIIGCFLLIWLVKKFIFSKPKA